MGFSPQRVCYLIFLPAIYEGFSTHSSKVCVVKAVVFPVVMHACESWTIKEQSTKGGRALKN